MKIIEWKHLSLVNSCKAAPGNQAMLESVFRYRREPEAVGTVDPGFSNS